VSRNKKRRVDKGKREKRRKIRNESQGGARNRKTSKVVRKGAHKKETLRHNRAAGPEAEKKKGRRPHRPHEPCHGCQCQLNQSEGPAKKGRGEKTSVDRVWPKECGDAEKSDRWGNIQRPSTGRDTRKTRALFGGGKKKKLSDRRKVAAKKKRTKSGSTSTRNVVGKKPQSLKSNQAGEKAVRRKNRSRRQ